MDNRRTTDEEVLADLQRQLAFWRERMQIAGSTCRSGVQREHATRQMQDVQQRIDVIRERHGWPESEVKS